MNSHESEDEKELHIDEDWKARVEAEKERARVGQAPDELHEEPAETPEPQAEPSPEPAAESPQDEETITPDMIPPASFAFLITSISTQALMALGQIPTEHGVHLELAKLHIDTLEVLQEKTRGNLTPDEAAMLDTVLYQLRMAYVQIKNRAQGGEKKEA